MNCKQNDLAIVVSCNPGEEWALGQIVKCHNPSTSPEGEAGWDILPPLVDYQGGLWWGCEDKFLRPIRDTDGVDETLTWAGKPCEASA